MKRKPINITILIAVLIAILISMFKEKEENDISYKKQNQDERNLNERISVTTDNYNQDVDVSKLKNYTNIARESLYWHHIEKTKGIYDFTKFDSYNARLIANGVKPWYILGYSNVLYTNSSNHFAAISTEDAKQGFINYAKASAYRYKGQGNIYEIFNEANSSQYWNPQTNVSTDLADLIKRTSKEIKAIDPTATIVAPSISKIDLNFLQSLFEKGILDYVDAIAVHPYRKENPESVISGYASLKALISIYTNRNIQLLNGEWGYSTPLNWNGQGNQAVVDLDTQAKFYPRMVMVDILSGVYITNLFMYEDRGHNEMLVEDNFGLIRDDGITEKPVAISLRLLKEILGEFHFIKRLPNTNKDDYVLLFKNKDGKLAYVAWTTSDKHNFTFSKKVYGNVIHLDSSGKKEKIKSNLIRLTDTIKVILCD